MNLLSFGMMKCFIVMWVFACSQQLGICPLCESFSWISRTNPFRIKLQLARQAQTSTPAQENQKGETAIHESHFFRYSVTLI
jgi:hypothetical protein